MQSSTTLAAAAAMTLCVAASPAWAASSRAWVSGHGVDQAGCGAPTAPCRSLQYVHDHVVAAGGEIDILDPAGYGAITITKAISIVNDGVGTAGLQATSGNAITINAGPIDAIYLRGLNLDGLQRSASRGVAFNAGGGLTVVNCVARNFAHEGLLLAPTSGFSSVKIYDSLFLNNGGAGFAYAPSSGDASMDATIDHVRSSGNTFGFAVDATSNTGAAIVTISESDASQNFNGVLADGANNNLFMGINNSTINANTTSGIRALDDITVHIARSVIDANGDVGIFNETAPPGAIFSSGDNDVEGDVGGAIGGATPTPDIRQ